MGTIRLGKGAWVQILARARETGGHCSVVIGGMEAGLSGPPLHRHAGFTETYVVLAGRLELRRGGELIELGAGDVAVVPRGVAHSFRIGGHEAARWVNVFSPGGFEEYLEEVADLLPDDAPPSPDALAEVAARHGLELVGSEDGDA